MADWLSPHADGLRIRVRITPRASRSEVRGIETDAAGARHLAVRVNAPPDGGRANGELLRLLARRWGLPARDLTLVGGQTARQKVLHLDGSADLLGRTLRAIENDRAPAGGRP